MIIISVIITNVIIVVKSVSGVLSFNTRVLSIENYNNKLTETAFEFAQCSEFFLNIGVYFYVRNRCYYYNENKVTFGGIFFGFIKLCEVKITLVVFKFPQNILV